MQEGMRLTQMWQARLQMADANVYHVELRQFPHNHCRFNLSKRELQSTILGDWVNERWIELGERRWNPQQARLTVIEGPRLSLGQLSMGRGWRAAQRGGEDVTERLLAEMRGSASAPPFADGPNEDLLADSLGLELLGVLGAGRRSPNEVWKLTQERFPERSAGQCLVLAERAVASLLRSQLIVLDAGQAASIAPSAAERPMASGMQVQALPLSQAPPLSIDVWSDPKAEIHLRRYVES
jgi:hypothetical protein